jgi:hypothetical protein
MAIEQSRYKVSLFQAMVLLHNLLSCDDGDNDANRTRDELFRELNKKQVHLDKNVLESLLYCSNINDEDDKFWHPMGMKFDKFVKYVLPAKHNFHFIYNFIVHEKNNN